MFRVRTLVVVCLCQAVAACESHEQQNSVSISTDTDVATTSATTSIADNTSGSNDTETPLGSSCQDQLQNGHESDVDCGGPDCLPCSIDQACISASDCGSALCIDGSCAPVACKEDDECAHLSDTCVLGSCDAGICTAVFASDASPCSSETACISGETCKQGLCQGGEQVDCSHLDTDCDRGSCEPSTNSCELLAGRVFQARFDVLSESGRIDEDAWEFDEPTNWRIEAAFASNGCTQGDTPAEDRSIDGRGQLLSNAVGGCLLTDFNGQDCVYSPSIDLLHRPEELFVSYWQHRHTLASEASLLRVLFLDFDHHWQEAWRNDVAVNDAQWQHQALEIGPDYRHAAFRVAFCYTLPRLEASGIGGWSIDDVAVSPLSCNLE